MQSLYKGELHLLLAFQQTGEVNLKRKRGGEGKGSKIAFLVMIPYVTTACVVLADGSF